MKGFYASKKHIAKAWRQIFGVVWPLVLLPLLLKVGTLEAKCGFVLLLMAGYFTFEPIPLSVSALLPVFLFPMLGIMGTTQTCYQYMKDTIMMYLGGLLFAAAVEYSNLHKRIALKVLLSIGTSPRWVMLGFMGTTMFLSMWITNTATTAMMVPIVDAVISELRKEFDLVGRGVRRKSGSSGKHRKSLIPEPKLPPVPEEKLNNLSTSVTIINEWKVPVCDEREESCTEAAEAMLSSLHRALMLSLAFAASFGGTGTLIGSGPNLVLKAQIDELFPDYRDLTFSTWMMYNIPGMLISTFVLWIVFQGLFLPCCQETNEVARENKRIVRNVIQRNYDELGHVTFHEFAVLILFLTLVLLWLMREPQFMKGWGDVFLYGKYIKDATPAIGVSILLFLVPAKPKEFGSSTPLLEWKVAQAKIPWGVLILLGGGIALAQGSQESGLSQWISQKLSLLEGMPPDAIAVILCLLTSALTEFISNMSMATIMLPVVCQMAIASKVHPLLYMLPTTIACSFAFMLPVGNPSNAIVFDSCDMTTWQMVKPGIIVKIIACAIELAMIKTLGVTMFNLHSFPQWANKSFDVSLYLQNQSDVATFH